MSETGEVQCAQNESVPVQETSDQPTTVAVTDAVATSMNTTTSVPAPASVSASAPASVSASAVPLPTANDPKKTKQGPAAIASELLACGCCNACILRLLGAKNLHHYPNPQDSLKSEYGVSVERTESERVCCVCEGILQLPYKEEWITEFVTRVNADGHEFETFIVAALIPYSLPIRTRSIWLHLNTKFPADYAGKDEDSSIVSVKDALKWIVGLALNDRLKNARFRFGSPFSISMTFEHRETEDDISFLRQLKNTPLRARKNTKETITAPLVQDILSTCSDTTFRKLGVIPPKCPNTFASMIELALLHEPVYIAGRYCKYSRDLSQTPWIIEDSRRTQSSVQELSSKYVQLALRCDEAKFSASGREDVDVRMLGSGRPFVLECINPKRPFLSQEELAKIQAETNAATELIQVNSLAMITRDDTEILKDGEDSKTKSYACVVWMSEDRTDEELQFLNQTKDLQLIQKTPIRVLHRRSLADRERTVYTLSFERIKPQFIKLRLSTQAGTYVKEFVHGDFGRTVPSLSSLLNCDCDILSLDVENIDLEWPPAASAASTQGKKK